MIDVYVSCRCDCALGSPKNECRFCLATFKSPFDKVRHSKTTTTDDLPDQNTLSNSFQNQKLTNLRPLYTIYYTKPIGHISTTTTTHKQKKTCVVIYKTRQDLIRHPTVIVRRGTLLFSCWFV